MPLPFMIIDPARSPVMQIMLFLSTRLIKKHTRIPRTTCKILFQLSSLELRRPRDFDVQKSTESSTTFITEDKFTSLWFVIAAK